MIYAPFYFSVPAYHSILDHIFYFLVKKHVQWYFLRKETFFQYEIQINSPLWSFGFTVDMTFLIFPLQTYFLSLATLQLSTFPLCP